MTLLKVDWVSMLICGCNTVAAATLGMLIGGWITMLEIDAALGPDPWLKLLTRFLT